MPLTTPQRGVAAFAALSLVAAAALVQRPDPTNTDPASTIPASQVVRAVSYRQLDPTLTTSDALVLASRSEAWLAQAGGTPQAVGDALEALAPTEEELRSAFEERRALFGRRSYDSVRPTLDRMIRLERFRATMSDEGSP